MPGQLVGDIIRENFQIETSLVHRVLDKNGKNAWNECLGGLFDRPVYSVGPLL